MSRGEDMHGIRQRVTRLVNDYTPEAAPVLSEEDVMDLIGDV